MYFIQVWCCWIINTFKTEENTGNLSVQLISATNYLYKINSTQAETALPQLIVPFLPLYLKFDTEPFLLPGTSVYLDLYQAIPAYLWNFCSFPLTLLSSCVLPFLPVYGDYRLLKDYVYLVHSGHIMMEKLLNIKHINNLVSFAESGWFS